MKQLEYIITFIIFFVLFIFFFIYSPIYLKSNNLYIGGDSVGFTGILKQFMIKWENKEFSAKDVFLKQEVILKDVNWPKGVKITTFSMFPGIVFLSLYKNEIAAFFATNVFFIFLNIFSVFFILRKFLKLPFLLSVIFSIISTSFPYFYWQVQHLSLLSFWQIVFLYYFIIKFIDKPSLKNIIGIIIFIWLNVIINIQIAYFVFLVFLPIIPIILIYRYRFIEDEIKTQYIADIIKNGILLVIGCIFIFYFYIYLKYLKPYTYIDPVLNKKVIEKTLPIRDVEELKIWAPPLYGFILPTSENILFGKFTQHIFRKHWGFHEKAVYMSFFMEISFLFIIIFFIRKYGLKKLRKYIFSEYSIKHMFLIFSLFIVGFSLFFVVSTKIDFLAKVLHELNKSARVYSRMMDIILPFYTILFSFLFYFFIKNLITFSPFKKLILISIWIFLILLDVFPSTFKPIFIKIDPLPEEYIFLNKISKKGEVILDFFGRYGGYLEYGYIFYKKYIPGLKEMYPLYNVKTDEAFKNLLKYNVKYVMYYRKNPPWEEPDKFLKKYGFKLLFSNNRCQIYSR